MSLRHIKRWMRLTVLTCVMQCTCLALTACVSSDISRLDALTTPEPNALRERALRRLNLATAYFEQGQNTVAQQEVRAALQIDPQFADAYNLLGLIHQRDGAASLAEQSFQHAVQLASTGEALSATLASAQHNYGWLLCEQHRFTEAHTLLKRALRHTAYRQPAKTWMALGVCQQKAGQTADARQSFEQALKWDNHYPMARYQWASLEQATNPGRAQEILTPLNRSSDANPATLSLGIELAQALSQAHEAQALLAQLTQHFPNSIQAQAWLQKTPQDQ